MLQLESVAFNHDPHTNRGALNLRRNVGESVRLPEWQRGRNRTPADCPVLYALTRLRNETPTIVVQLKRTAAESSVLVRAVPKQSAVDPFRPAFLIPPQMIWPSNHWFSGWYEYANYLSYDAYYREWQESFARRPDALGQVAPTIVTFAPGNDHATVLMPLENVRLSSRGVGAIDIEWQWQYRTDAAGLWINFDATSTRVYTVVDEPTAPWVQQPADPRNTQLPWTDALDVACAWAVGAFSGRAAAESVTRKVFGLGDDLLEYGCPIGALAMYTSLIGPQLFYCTAFLDRVSGGVGNGRYVNCTDCASAVTTLANLLGADLWESRMGMYVPAFETNPIEAIGSDRFESPCGWGLGFTYHEVAWTGACTSDDFVYDACLRVETPGDAALGRTIPTHMRFGRNGDGQYRDLIAAPLSRDVCIPRPDERLRRAVT